MLVRRKVLIPALAVALVGLTAGCGGGSSSSSSSGSGGTSGSAVKLGMISDVGDAVDFADSVAAARAAVRGLNTRGGINGHPVQLVFCNESLDPNKAAACVRQMISAKVTAMVGDEIVTYEQSADQLFARAGIPSVAPVSYGYDAKDPNSYLIASGQEFLNAAQAVAAVKYGGPRVGLVRVDIPTTVPFKAALQKALPSLGGTFAGEQTQPETAGDLSAEAAALLQDKPDVVTTDANESADVQIFKGMDALGYKGKMVIAADAFKLSTIKTLGPLADRLLVASAFPPISAAASIPGLQQFKTDMAAELASGDKDAAGYAESDRDVAYLGYFGVVAVAKVANAAKVDDAAGLKKALNSAQNVDLGGVVPPWTPNKSVSKTIPRASNDAMYLSEWTSSGPKLLLDKPIQVAAMVDASNG